MNSQDRPINDNENLNESWSADNSDSSSAEKSVDLWSQDGEEAEIVTEIISVEQAESNNAESLAEVLGTEEQAQPKKKKADLNLDDWDFRNVDYAEPDLDEEPLDESKVEPSAAAEVAQDEVETVAATSESEVPASLEELDEALSTETVAESSLTELSLSLDDMGLSDRDDLLEPPLSVADDPEQALDNLELEGIDESVEFDLAIEPEPLGEINLEGVSELGAAELTLEASSELPDLDLSLEDNSLELDIDVTGNTNDLDSLGLTDLNDGGLDSLDSLSDGLDSNLDDLLDLSPSSNLDAVLEEPLASLDALSVELDSAGELSADLDSLLDDGLASEAPTVINPDIPTPQPVAQVSNPAPAPAPAPTKTQAFDQTMRVSVRKLDNLNNLIGELVVKRNRLEDDQERLRRFLDNLLGHVQSLGEAGAKMHDMYERSLLEGALMASRQSRANSAVAAGIGAASEESQEEGLDALEMDRFTGFHLLSQDIIELIVRVREAASDIQFVVDETDKVAQTFRQVTSQLQDGMNSSRMVAFGQTADRLPRAVRDISRKQKKQTQLHVEGKDVLIDKMIVEHIYNPMTHLVNNAISHGIEAPEIRLKNGKTEVGNVYIRAFIQGNQTVITVRDDGAGINPTIVKEKAVEKGILSWAAAQQLSDPQVYELLFHPGFSTKDEADDFAGRGVGMDVVNTDLKKIRGSIGTESELGKGTTFTIRLPLVLSICKALTCVNNNTKIAFPIDGVEDTKEYLPSDIQTNVNGVRSVVWNDKTLPLRPLDSLLNYNRQIRRAGIYNANQNNDDTVSVVILRSLDNLLAIEIDEVRAEQEIVIKQIDGPIPKPPGIAGATVLGDGSIMPIGDVLELIEIAQGKRTIEIGFNILAGAGDVKQAQIESVQQEPMVLVVDDSITVRELLSMSFNKLGYRVEQARDGQEAWDKLRGGLVCDMIFSDIEMPRMNGLELLSNLHQDSGLRSIPVAMLTSRGADKHRQIANDLGAKAYLTKPYTEKDLMDVAQHLIEINRANQEIESGNLKVNRGSDRAAEFEDAPLVLIIDDSVTVRELLSMTFKKAGYRVEQARDGQEAWEKLSDGLEVDIAFCDIEMPRMNGLELLSQLQKDEKLAELPIAMLTSRGAQKMRNIAASRGANGYFVKPYVEEDLLKAAKKMMDGEMLIEGAEDDS